jgi:hypothetical protein
MSTKVLFRWFFVTSLAGILILAVMGGVPVHAQCEDPQPSSCTTCHAQEDPVHEKGEWHIIHASKDICMNCHGGNGSAMEKDLAHENLMAHPLDDIYTDCHSCHPDYDERAARFAPTLGVTPSSCTTPTSVPIVSNFPDEPSAVSINMPVDPASSISSLQLFWVVGAWLSILTLLLFGMRWLERHHVKG